jgi:hypothetical protein
MWTDSILGAEPQNSSAIMTNNISVCFMTFASGIVFGLGTLWYMIFNGFNVGLIATVCAQHGMALSLWSFVAAHGALELPSIFISGGAGLRLTTGLLFPGFLRRRDALAQAGGEAIRLLAGTIPLLIIAGTVEGPDGVEVLDLRRAADGDDALAQRGLAPPFCAPGLSLPGLSLPGLSVPGLSVPGGRSTRDRAPSVDVRASACHAFGVESGLPWPEPKSLANPL